MKHGWEYRDFEKCLEKVVYTPKLQSSNYQENGKYPIVSQEDCLISGYWDKEDDVFRLVKPIVVFGDHTRILKYIDFDFVLGADGVKILQPTDDIKAKFLYYYLKWYDVPSLGYSRHYKLLKECIVPIPPTHVQEQICSLLDKMNRVIEAKKEQLKELDNLAQAIFYDMFGDPVTNEKGWVIRKWNDCLTIFNGRNQKQVENVNGQYPICGSGGVMGRANQYITPENSVIIGRKGNINKPILMREKFWNVDTAFGVLPNGTELLVDYLFYFCVFFDFEQLNKAVTIPSLTKTDLLGLNMPVPPLPLQQAFAEKVEAIERQKELINQSLREVQTLFDSRMDYWFSEENDDLGQLDKLD